MRLPPEVVRLVRLALAEDLSPRGDLTTLHFLPPARLRARVVAKQAGVFCGADLAAAVFRLTAPGSKVRALAREGAAVRPGRAVFEVTGPRGILSGERTALNFLSRLSGIATLTRRFAAAVRGTGVGLYDTRKTTPGWRWLEKYAVLCGGGRNHRMGLYDSVMLKDNHLAVLRRRGVGASQLCLRIEAFRRRLPGVEIEIEADGLSGVRLALSCGADAVLLDNMPILRLGRAIRRIRRLSPRAIVEVSGGVTLANVRRIARLKPDRVSVGRITHSAPALDLSLEIDAG